MNRKQTLEKAMAIVNGDRDETYGAPEDNFNTIASLWGIYLNRDIAAYDVAVMMILMKVARLSSCSEKDSLDSWVDVAGYAACGCEIATGDDDE